MKYLIFLPLMVSTAWSKPLVLISYFDAFNRAPFNNSERVARALETRLSPTLNIKLCPLNTIFDKAYAQTEECLKSLPEIPVMILGLGEATCDLKIEAMMKNQDKTYGADNAGNQRNNTTIIPEGPLYLGLRYPLPQMYCALNSSEKKALVVSNNAGSFVCNNTAYQMSYYYPDMQYGFIHVPANNCANLGKRTQEAIEALEKMILGGVNYLSQNNEPDRLPTTKKELKSIRREVADPCLNDFYQRLKGHDERRTFFTGLMN